MKSAKHTGNWTPEGNAERAALRRDHTELTPAQRTEQVFELSRFMSRVAEAGAADAVPGVDIDVDESRLRPAPASPDEGLVNWLLACPEKGYFVAIDPESSDAP